MLVITSPARAALRSASSTRAQPQAGGGPTRRAAHQEEVGHGLRLHALRRVDQQERALAGRQRARHLVAEVCVAIAFCVRP